MVIDRVESRHGYGPRGDDYEWCNLHDDGTLEFGDEQGNYCGGTYLSADFCPYGDYWGNVKKRLKGFFENHYDYYYSIVKMIEKNNTTLPFDLRDVWEGIWPEHAVKHMEICPVCGDKNINIYFKDGFWMCKKCLNEEDDAANCSE